MWLLKLTILDVYIRLKSQRQFRRLLIKQREDVYIYVGGYLNIYTVVARKVQRGRIYKSLARKGMFSQKSYILVVLEEATRSVL